jgi:hypothetical protein
MYIAYVQYILYIYMYIYVYILYVYVCVYIYYIYTYCARAHTHTYNLHTVWAHKVQSMLLLRQHISNTSATH